MPLNQSNHPHLRNNLHYMRPLIQIQRWLQQPNVWSFVCFASSVVGLLCYALSSSSTNLFGKWNWWKILLYIAVNSTICLLYLFAKRRQDYTTPWLQVNLTSLVLIITSAYSYFSDKKTKGKPDSYIIVSWAAFAVVSLCLSRRIHYGFEVDLLSFFCGGLIIQLMKLNLWLVIVGACFTYSLIVLRASLELDAPSRNEHLRRSSSDVPGHHVLLQVLSESQETNTGTGDANLIIMPQEANNTIDSGFEENSCAQEGNSDSGVIMPLFMDSVEALKKENQKLMSMVSEYVDKYSEAGGAFHSFSKIPVDVNLVIDALPSGRINDLHEKVKLMVEAGFEEECCNLYSSWRREFLEEYLSTFGLQVQDLNVWNIKGKIDSWEKAFKVAVKILFPNERRLLDRVFHGLSAATEISFVEVCTQSTMHLLSFPDALLVKIAAPAQSSRHRLSSSDTFSIIDRVCNTLDFLFPYFNFMFEDHNSSVLLDQVFMLWHILPLKMDISGYICRDVAKGDAVEGIIDKVMRLVSDFCQKIMHFSINVPPSHYTLLIDRLESHMEAKSQQYRNPARGYVYMMNNLNHMRSTAKMLKLKAFLSNDWLAKINGKIQEKLELYQRSSWNKLLDLLKLDNNESMEPSVVAESMKAKLNLFNLHFEETSEVQSHWSINDKQLRQQTIIYLENILLPAYGNFILRFRHVLGKHNDECIKYETLHIQGRLSNLFGE